jgi:hypothetical protein
VILRGGHIDSSAPEPIFGLLPRLLAPAAPAAPDASQGVGLCFEQCPEVSDAFLEQWAEYNVRMSEGAPDAPTASAAPPPARLSLSFARCGRQLLPSGSLEGGTYLVDREAPMLSMRALDASLSGAAESVFGGIAPTAAAAAEMLLRTHQLSGLNLPLLVEAARLRIRERLQAWTVEEVTDSPNAPTAAPEPAVESAIDRATAGFLGLVPLTGRGLCALLSAPGPCPAPTSRLPLGAVLRSLTLRQCGYLTDRAVSALCALCPRLAHLELAACHLLDGSCLPALLSLHALSSLSLAFSGAAVTTAAAFRENALAALGSRGADVASGPGDSDLESNGVSCVNEPPARVWRHLRHLDLSLCPWLDDAVLESLRRRCFPPGARGPFLETLALGGALHLTAPAIVAFVAAATGTSVSADVLDLQAHTERGGDAALASPSGSAAAYAFALVGDGNASFASHTGLSSASPSCALRRLDLSHTPGVTDSAAALCLDMCRTTLAEALLSGCSKVAMRTYAALGRCRGLERLESRLTVRVNKACVEAMVQAAAEADRAMSQTTANLFGPPNGNWAPRPPRNIRPSKTTMAVAALGRGWAAMPHLSSVDLWRAIEMDDDAVSILASHCPRLTTLSLDGLQVGLSDRVCADLRSYCPLLRSLILNSVPLSDFGIAALCKETSGKGAAVREGRVKQSAAGLRLQTLDLSFNPEYTFKGLRRAILSEALHNSCLRLDLNCCPGVSDLLLHLVCEHMPRLTHLGIARCGLAPEFANNMVLTIKVHEIQAAPAALTDRPAWHESLFGSEITTPDTGSSLLRPRIVLSEFSDAKLSDAGLARLAMHIRRSIIVSGALTKDLAPSSRDVRETTDDDEHEDDDDDSFTTDEDSNSDNSQFDDSDNSSDDAITRPRTIPSGVDSATSSGAPSACRVSNLCSLDISSVPGFTVVGIAAFLTNHVTLPGNECSLNELSFAEGLEVKHLEGLTRRICVLQMQRRGSQAALHCAERAKDKTMVPISLYGPASQHGTVAVASRRWGCLRTIESVVPGLKLE